MTMALVYKNNNEAFFLQDFRITYPNLEYKQIDSMMKFTIFDDRIGMYFAGNVRVIKTIISEIRKIESKITIDNIMKKDGILARNLDEYMRKNPENYQYTNIEILGFIVDTNNKKNTCFYMKLIPGIGISIESIDDNRVKVIGSGRCIPKIEILLTNIANDSINKQYDLNTVVNAVGQEIKKIFISIGVSYYGKLGISPIFAKSLLVNDYFKMIGEENSGENFTTDFNINDGPGENIKFKYSLYVKDKKIFLDDKINNKKIVVKNAENFSEESTDNIFDPERFSKKFDPSKKLCENGVAYVINQWVTGDVYINRTIDRSQLINNVLDPEYTRLANESREVKDANEYKKYIMSGNCSLIVRKDLQYIFETEVDKHLFDHEWMEKYVDNYFDIYLEEEL